MYFFGFQQEVDKEVKVCREWQYDKGNKQVWIKNDQTKVWP